MLADDTSLILKDMASVEQAFQEFQSFAKYLGLQINLERTEIIPIGSNTSKHNSEPNSLLKIKIRKL